MTNERPLGRVFLAGFIATFVMTLMTYPMYWAEVPKMDYATLIGAWLAGKQVAPFSDSWWAGLLEHFFNGSIIFPLIFAYWIHAILPAGSIVRGALWGGLLWILAQTVAMPLLGGGLFSSQTANPPLYLLATGIGHLIYGILFSAVVGKCLECAPVKESPSAPRSVDENKRKVG